MISQKSRSDEIDLMEVGALVWSSRLLVLIVTMISTSVGLAYAFLSTEWFRSEIVMVAADRKSAPAGLGQLGGLASLAGINLSSGGNPEPVAVLKSRAFAESFITQMTLVPILLDDETSNGETADIRRAVKIFDEQVRYVTEDKKTGTVILAMEWKDSQLASSWANAYVAKLNDHLRGQALGESQRNVNFLKREITSSDVVQLRQSLGAVLESEMQKLLLARGSESFAFKVVDKATPPLKRTKPNRPAIVLMSAMFGLFSSIAYIFLRRFSQRLKAKYQ
jgi:uncharacterized protein involved in exopolysaccharide biosynthesis